MSPESILIIHVLIYLLTYTILFLHYYLLRNKGKSLQTIVYQAILYSSWFPDTISMAIAIVLFVNEVDLRRKFHNDMTLINENLMNSLTGKAFFWGELGYFLTLSTIKAAYLVFYSQLYMRTSERTCRLHVYHIACAIWAIVTVGGLLLQFLYCLPFDLNWKKPAAGEPRNPHCPAIFQFEVFTSTAIAMILSDIAILLVPLTVISSLGLGKREKLGLLFIFVIGIMSILASVARLAFVGSKIKEQAFTLDTSHAFALISHGESFLAAFAIAMPSFRRPIPNAIKRFLRLTTTKISSVTRSITENKSRKSQPGETEVQLKELAAAKELEIMARGPPRESVESGGVTINEVRSIPPSRAEPVQFTSWV